MSPEGPAPIVLDEQVRGSHAYLDHPWLIGLDGLRQLRHQTRPEFPHPPMQHLTGLRIVEAGPGTSTWTMPATAWWQHASGPFLAGTYGVVADAALGGAIHTLNPPGMWTMTSELSLNFVRAASPASGNLIARGRLIQSGRGHGLSEAVIEDSEGRLLAHATTRCLLRGFPVDPPDPPEDIAWDAPEYDTPDPYERGAEGELLPPEFWRERGPAEASLGWASGELPLPPAGRLFGWRLDVHEPGRIALRFPASPWLTTAGNTFFGGFTAYFLDAAMSSALGSTLPPGSSFGSLDLKINFMRPVQPDGRDLTVRSEVTHQGRTVAVMRGEIESADGKIVAVAQSSAMIFDNPDWLRATGAKAGER